MSEGVEILLIVAGVSVIVVAVLLSVVLAYALRVLYQVKKVIASIRKGGEIISHLGIIEKAVEKPLVTIASLFALFKRNKK